MKKVQVSQIWYFPLNPRQYKQGRSQSHSSGWARFPLSLFSPQISITFSYFPHFVLLFFLILALRVGDSPARKGPGYATEYKLICTNSHCTSNPELPVYKPVSLSTGYNENTYQQLTISMPLIPPFLSQNVIFDPNHDYINITSLYWPKYPESQYLHLHLNFLRSAICSTAGIKKKACLTMLINL